MAAVSHQYQQLKISVIEIAKNYLKTGDLKKRQKYMYPTICSIWIVRYPYTWISRHCWLAKYPDTKKLKYPIIQLAIYPKELGYPIIQVSMVSNYPDIRKKVVSTHPHTKIKSN